MDTVFDKKEECCGCTACKSICPTRAIKMIYDDEGFLYPQINAELCIECGRCRKVCPFRNEITIDDKLEEALVYAVKHIDLEVRRESASGGMYTAISNNMLAKEGLVYGARFDKYFRVVHARASNVARRDEFRGSKYIQSNLGDIFIQIQKELEYGQNVLFTGTGCQVAGLRKFLADAKINTDKLICNDIICHGTTSPLLWNEYLKFIQKDSKLSTYTFRYKEKGWRGYNVRAQYKNGKTKVNSLSLTVYANLFQSDLVLRPSCYHCKFANMDRISDIMIGDFWGIEKTMPKIDDDKGISLVLVNTIKGKEMFDTIKSELDIWESNAQDCLQPNLIEPSKIPEDRDQFWQEYHDKGFEHIASKYGGYNLKGIVKKMLKKLFI